MNYKQTISTRIKTLKIMYTDSFEKTVLVPNRLISIKISCLHSQCGKILEEAHSTSIVPELWSLPICMPRMNLTSIQFCEKPILRTMSKISKGHFVEM